MFAGCIVLMYAYDSQSLPTYILFIKFRKLFIDCVSNLAVSVCIIAGLSHCKCDWEGEH